MKEEIKSKNKKEKKKMSKEKKIILAIILVVVIAFGYYVISERQKNNIIESTRTFNKEIDSALDDLSNIQEVIISYWDKYIDGKYTDWDTAMLNFNADYFEEIKETKTAYNNLTSRYLKSKKVNTFGNKDTKILLEKVEELYNSYDELYNYTYNFNATYVTYKSKFADLYSTCNSKSNSLNTTINRMILN